MHRAKHKAKRKDNRDFAEVAFDVFQRAATNADSIDRRESTKNPAAVALGSMGGHARARNLSATQRKRIARKAARKRWKKRSRNK